MVYFFVLEVDVFGYDGNKYIIFVEMVIEGVAVKATPVVDIFQVDDKCGEMMYMIFGIWFFIGIDMMEKECIQVNVWLG